MNLVAAGVIFAIAAAVSSCSDYFGKGPGVELRLDRVGTLAGRHRELGEPFGIAVKGDRIYVSDGERGNIVAIDGDGTVSTFATGFSTPSGIAFAAPGNLIVADTGSNTVKSVAEDGSVAIVAGTENQRGFSDGEARSSLFNGPVGVAVLPDGSIAVADTYNDRIRLIREGKVTTLAGSSKGFADGPGSAAKFDTPLGLAVWKGDRLLVADSGNGRIRIVDLNGDSSTLAGTGVLESHDGTISTASIDRPSAIAAGPNGSLFVTDGNAIRAIGLRSFPVVETISSTRRGIADGGSSAARFNRPSGIALDSGGRLIVADSENQLVRAYGEGVSPITKDEIAKLRYSADEFRSAAPARWPFDPPLAKREIAGTLGEVRGDYQPRSDKPIWFHNGLDIAGAYGETARFVRTETVLDPHAVENVGGPRELIRLPTMGYIHIRLGRDSSDRFFPQTPFQPVLDPATGKLADLRVPRGTKFRAGDPIGTLNALNHVHMIAGRTGAEINALAALDLPGLSDGIPPVIEDVSFFDAKWGEIETVGAGKRIILNDPVRVVVRAYDRVDGNSERRRLGVYRVGYQILKDGAALADPVWSISFDRMPANEAVKFVYAPGSRSGYTPDTVFDYIVSDRVDADGFGEGFLETASLPNGNFTFRAWAADYFGNTAYRDINFEVAK